MEPPLINDSTFSPANTSSYSLSEIWPMPFPPDPDNNSTLTHLTPPPPPPPRRKRNLPPPNHPDDCGNNKHVKLGGSSGDENGALKAEPDATSVVAGGEKLPPEEEQNAKPSDSEPPKQDYIHVRARRGQATDSHSLAERARREKISERMKILQDLVPGCNKVIGKALVLDEIINYIQSLQRQVEFLSMKLEAVNSRLNMNPAVECFPSKEVGTQPFDLAGIIFGSQEAQGSQPGWLHMQIAGGFEKAT